MAGTRLCIQVLVVLELLIVAGWAFYHGLCRKEDILCLRLWDLIHPPDPVELPKRLSSPLPLPPIEVDKPGYSTELTYQKNPNTIIVCSQPESPVVEGKLVWWCPSREPEPRIVLRQSALIVYSQESQLKQILMPDNVPLPSTLLVSVILERHENDSETAMMAQEWAQLIHATGGVESLQQWPCVGEVKVRMNLVPALSSSWAEKIQDEMNANETVQILPALTQSQVETLLQNVGSSSVSDLELVVYIPEVPTSKTTVWKSADPAQQKIVMVGGGWDKAAVYSWLAGYMGIPSDLSMDSDGSFPSWYQAWYWHAAAEKFSVQITQEFAQVKHLLRDPILAMHEVDSGKSYLPEEVALQHYQALERIHKMLQQSLTTSTLESHFPIEHYAAVFAPLLFPLLVPFLVGIVKEYKRFKEKRQKKLAKQE